jgi:hypothetical protein
MRNTNSLLVEETCSPHESSQLGSISLDFRESFNHVIHIAFRADQYLLGHVHARGAEFIIVGTVILLPVFVQAFLAIYSAEPPGIQIVFDEGFLVEGRITGANGDALGVQCLDESFARCSMDLRFFVPKAEAIVILSR